MTGPKASPGKWMVHHGIHAGTITTRDAGTREHDSEDEACADFAKSKRFYANLGYVTWYAYLYDDKGNKKVLDCGEPYDDGYTSLNRPTRFDYQGQPIPKRKF